MLLSAERRRGAAAAPELALLMGKREDCRDADAAACAARVADEEASYLFGDEWRLRAARLFRGGEGGEGGGEGESGGEGGSGGGEGEGGGGSSGGGGALWLPGAKACVKCRARRAPAGGLGPGRGGAARGARGAARRRARGRRSGRLLHAQPALVAGGRGRQQQRRARGRAGAAVCAGRAAAIAKVRYRGRASAKVTTAEDRSWCATHCGRHASQGL